MVCKWELYGLEDLGRDFGGQRGNFRREKNGLKWGICRDTREHM